MTFLHLSKLLGKSQPFYALQFRGVDGILQPHKTVEDIAAEFIADIRCVQPNGPYYIGGYSFGGIVAYEMIEALIKNGEPIGGLVLIDTAVPRRYKWPLTKRISIRLSNFLSKDPKYIVERIVSHLHLRKPQKHPQNENSTAFKKRFDLVGSCNREAGLKYKLRPIETNVLFIKSALKVPPHMIITFFQQGIKANGTIRLLPIVYISV